MSYEPKEGDGSLFRNSQKQDGDTKPDYTGKILIGGVSYRVAGWVKEGKDGGKNWLSLKASLPQEKPATSGTSQPDNDLPF